MAKKGTTAEAAVEETGGTTEQAETGGNTEQAGRRRLAEPRRKPAGTPNRRRESGWCTLAPV